MRFLLKMNYKKFQSIIRYHCSQTCSCSQLWITQLTQKMKAQINAVFQSQNTKEKIKSGPYLCGEYDHRPSTKENLTQE